MTEPMIVLLISFLLSFLAVILSTSEWLRSSFVSNPAGSLMAISVYLLITGWEFLRQAREEIKALHSPQHIRRKYYTFTGLMAGSLHGAISSLILNYTDWNESAHLAHFIGWGLVLPVASGCLSVWVSLWACKKVANHIISKPTPTDNSP